MDGRGRYQLADALGDTPETVISIHLLRQGLCRAYVFGGQEDFAAALIQPTEDPGEPTAFGEDVPALWQLLRLATDWWCVNVSASLAHELAAIMERELRCSVRLYGDVYHTLRQPSPPFDNPAVRLLTIDDLPLVEGAPTEVRGTGFGSQRAMLSDGIVAGAVISGGLAAIAFTSAMTERHADIGVATLER